MNDRRVKIRVDLCGLYLPFYDHLCELLPEEWQPYSGFRSFAAQDTLYSQGRGRPGGIVTNAKAGESAHNYGCATDWTRWEPGGVPIWMKPEDEYWYFYVEAVTEAGLRAGIEFGDIDHNEVKIARPWTDILKAWNEGGGAAGDGLKMAIDTIRAATY